MPPSWAPVAGAGRCWSVARPGCTSEPWVANGRCRRGRSGRCSRRRRAPQRGRSVDLVVLAPPRAGAGRTVVAGIVSRHPRAVVYVACDPAALARDVSTFVDYGWRLSVLRAYDLFPQTHHVECVALLV